MTLTRSAQRRAPAPHTVPGDLLEAIARGGDGPALAFLMQAQRSKSALLTRAMADLTAAGGHPDADRLRQARQVLRAAAQCSPSTVHSVLTYPSVSNWAMHTVAALSTGDRDATPGVLALVAVAAALRSGAEATIFLDPGVLHPQGLPLPSLGFLRLADVGGGAEVRVLPGERTLLVGRERFPLNPDGQPTGPRWQPIGRLSLPDGPQPWSLLLDNPHRMTPEPAPLLGPQAVADWHDRISAGWRQLIIRHPAAAVAVRTGIRTLLPLPSPGSGHVSGTFRHAFGCIGMSLPTDARATAVTLVHELQHMKLSATMDLVELIDMTSAERGYAPWRDDPRPPAGLLHGAYAHLGVAGFWRRQAACETDAGHRLRAQIEYVRWRDGAAEVSSDLLASAWLTLAGRRFVGAMLDQLMTWSRDAMPAEVAAAADRLNANHRQERA